MLQLKMFGRTSWTVSHRKSTLHNETFGPVVDIPPLHAPPRLEQSISGLGTAILPLSPTLIKLGREASQLALPSPGTDSVWDGPCWRTWPSSICDFIPSACYTWSNPGSRCTEIRTHSSTFFLPCTRIQNLRSTNAHVHPVCMTISSMV